MCREGRAVILVSETAWKKNTLKASRTANMSVLDLAEMLDIITFTRSVYSNQTALCMTTRTTSNQPTEKYRDPSSETSETPHINIHVHVEVAAELLDGWTVSTYPRRTLHD